MYTPKPTATIIAYDSLDAHTYRLCLEACNYHTEVIWVGSHEELKQIFNNSSTTKDIIVIDAHGDPNIGFVADSEENFTFADISAATGLQNKKIISTACYSGTSHFLDSFKQAGVETYVAPINAVSTPASIIFLTRLFYHLNKSAFYPEVATTNWNGAVIEAIGTNLDVWISH